MSSVASSNKRCEASTTAFPCPKLETVKTEVELALITSDEVVESVMFNLPQHAGVVGFLKLIASMLFKSGVLLWQTAEITKTKMRS